MSCQEMIRCKLPDEVDGFIAYQISRGHSPATVTHYHHDLSLLFRYLAKVLDCRVLDLTIDMVSPQLLEDFFTYLSEERKNCIRSNKRRLAAVRAFFNYIYSGGSELGHQPSAVNPVDGITSEKAESKPPQLLTEDQVIELLRAARANGSHPIRDYALLRLFLDCGASLSEVLNAKLQDVNLAQSYIRFAWGTPRSRVVPLSDETRHAIAQYITCRPESYREQLFLNRKGLPITKGTIYHMLSKCKSSIKLDPDTKVTPQTLRNTCFGHLARKGFNACELQALAGLRSGQMPRTMVKLAEIKRQETITANE